MRGPGQRISLARPKHEFTCTADVGTHDNSKKLSGSDMACIAGAL